MEFKTISSINMNILSLEKLFDSLSGKLTQSAIDKEAKVILGEYIRNRGEEHNQDKEKIKVLEKEINECREKIEDTDRRIKGAVTLLHQIGQVMEHKPVGLIAVTMQDYLLSKDMKTAISVDKM